MSYKVSGASSIALAVVRTVAFVISVAWTPPANAGPGWQFSDWSAPVNLGPDVNSAGPDQGPAISKNELELYFVRQVGVLGGSDPGDIWVTTRKHRTDPWGEPKNLGGIINTSGRESTPTLSLDGHLLYFSSDRPGGFGGFDIWVSERIDRHDPFGWQQPVNLGSGVNTVGQELGPAPFEDPSTQILTLYFYRIPPIPPGPPVAVHRDLFSSTLDENGSFTTAVPIAELNTLLFEDEQPSIRRDGLEMFFSSNRPGGFGGSDIWVSTRASTSEPWSPPVNLGPVINTGPVTNITLGIEQRPALSFDGRSLYFFSDRDAGLGRSTDLFVSTRIRLDEDRNDDDDDDSDDD